MDTLQMKAIVLCYKCFLTIFRTLCHWFLVVLFSGRKHVVPPINDPILLKSAITLASEIRQGKIKSEDVVKSYVNRIKEVNPYINAICEERFETALEESREVDKLVASGSKTLQQLEEEKPLLGIPVTVKMLFGVKGMPCNAGSLVHKDVKASEDAEAVALMKKAGAICLATTNTAEFGLNFETYNNIYGRTSNPYDTTRTAGGSSGGEGALVGSGASLIGLANDIAGSIRHPGNFNGVFGHKPTSGLISNKGVFPVPCPKTNDYLVAGPICRYAGDLVLATKIMSGPNANQIKLNSPVNFSTLKVYYLLDDGDPLTSKVSPEIKSTVIRAAQYFHSIHGADIMEIELKGMQQAFITYVHILILSLNKKLEDVLTAGKIDPSNEILKAVFGQSELTLGAITCLNYKKFPMIYSDNKCTEMVNRLKNLRKELNAILDENAVLILPTFTSTAHYHYEFTPIMLNVSFMCIFNMLGLPVTQCPAGLSKNGLPLGFQIAGAKGQDHLTISCALEMEKAFGGWVPPNNQSVKAECKAN